jgi:acetyl-CoA acetyltransferase
MDDVYVLGAGMTAFGKRTDRSLAELTAEAVHACLEDACCDAHDVQAACFSNAGQGAIEGQHMISGQIALRRIGLGGIPVLNVENACASASTAFHLACLYVKAGAADIVLAVGAEKMVTPQKERAFELLRGAQDVNDPDAMVRAVAALSGKEAGEAAGSAERSVFMDIYAGLAKQHMRLFGSTQRMFAAVTAKNRAHAVRNPYAQFRIASSIEEILAARPIAWPLTLPMCAPVSDGAAAAIVCSASALRRMGSSRAVRVYASVLASGTDRAADDLQAHITRKAAIQAYENAGVGPREISLAEVHDATAVGEVIQIETLGLYAAGEGGVAAELGESALGGRLPVNVSGGLECRGHPIGATGLGQIHELTRQLRHEAGANQVERARFAIAENGGGFLGVEEAAACITVLGPH